MNLHTPVEQQTSRKNVTIHCVNQTGKRPDITKICSLRCNHQHEINVHTQRKMSFDVKSREFGFYIDQ